MKVVYGLKIDGMTVNNTILINCFITSSILTGCTIIKCDNHLSQVVSCRTFFGTAIHCTQYQSSFVGTEKEGLSTLELLDPKQFDLEAGQPYLERTEETKKSLEILEKNLISLDDIYQKIFQIPVEENKTYKTISGAFNIDDVWIVFSIYQGNLHLRATEAYHRMIWGRHE